MYMYMYMYVMYMYMYNNIMSIVYRLVDLTQRLIEQTSSLNPDLLSSGEQQTGTAASCVREVLSIVENIPMQT